MYKKNKIFFATLIGIILICVFYLFSVKIEELMSEGARSRMVEIANHNASSIFDTFKKDINLLEKAAMKWEDIYDFSSDKSMETLQSTFYYTEYIRLGLDSPDGKSYTSDGKIVDVSDMGYLNDVLNGKIVLTEVMNTKIENLPCFAVVVPIYRNGEVIGALRGVYLANSLTESIEITSFEGEGYCNLVDAKGNYLFKSPKAKILYNEKNIFDVYKKTTFREGYNAEKIRNDLLTGKSAFSVYQIANEFRCVYYTPVGINDWYVLTSVPVDYLDKPMQEIRATAALLFSLLIILSSILIFYSYMYNRRVQHKLMEERDYLGHVLDNIPLPVFITNTKRELKLVNNIALELLGGTNKELIGKQCNIWNTCICNTENCSVEKLLKTGDSKTVFSMNDRHYQVSIAVLNGSEEETSGFVEVIQDMTDIMEIQMKLEATIQQMQKTEKELLMMEERYRIAMENTNDVILDYDFKSRTMFHTIQATKIYGVAQQVIDAPESLVRLGVVSEKCAEGYLDMFRKMSEGEAKVSCILLARAADGHDIWNRINFTAIFDSNYKPARAIGILQDITREKEAELRYEREARYRNLTVQDAALYYEVDLTEKRYLVGHEKVSANSKEPSDDYEVVTKLLIEHFVAKEDKEYVYSNISWESLLKTYQSGERKSVFQYRRTMPNGNECWVECTYYLFMETHSNNIQGICYIRDISATKELEFDLRQQAEHDLLTGLYNKLTTESRIAEYINSVQQSDNSGAFILIDLDDFKKINDTLGHDMGDFVLAETAHRLQSIFNTDDIIGRLGGDEFAVFLLNPKTIDNLLLMAQRVSESFRIPYTGCGNLYYVSSSIGISIFPQHGTSVAQLYKRADIALYCSKARGKDTFTIFEYE